MPGPKPKPTSLKLLQGNPGHQKLPQNEPKPRPITPEVPEYLNSDGIRRWNELLPELEMMGTLTIVDGDILGRYCHGFQRLLEAEAGIADEHVCARGTGGQMLSPWVAERNRAFDDMGKAAAQLGIGAADRSRIEVKKPDGSDKDTAKEILGVTAGGRKS